MEPPPKRLRILQSVEVDETNPDYVNAKQKQQLKFKGRLESIFAKYENMHESMSDEIDMKENKVVVDRGHLRRVGRQVRRKETILLDNLAEQMRESPERGEDEEYSEDELAPTQCPKASRGRSPKEIATTTPSTSTHLPPIPTTLAQPATPQMPSTPNPAAQLLQFVQFPTTPAGQQAQSSFYATLTQTINQAVQQAVAPLVSSIFQNTPLQFPSAAATSAITTPVPTADVVAPPTDPKWFFPPLAAQQDKPDAQQSSPTSRPAVTSLRRSPSQARTGGDAQSEAHEANANAEPENPDTCPASSPPNISIAALVKEDFEKQPRRTRPRVQAARKQKGSLQKYHFSDEDNLHITKSKLIEQCTWREIIDSRAKWHGWPLSAFHNHWALRLKGKKLHLSGVAAAKGAHDRDRQDTVDDSNTVLQQLPTPSASGHEEDTVELNESTQKPTQVMPSFGTQYDDDERDLLSIAGDEYDEEPLPVNNTNDDHEPFYPDADEVILPSIEIANFIDEDALQQGLLEDSPDEDTIIVEVPETSDAVQIKIEEVASSPTTRRKRARVTYQAIPDTESEDEPEDKISTNGPTSSAATLQSFTCTVCNASLKSEKNLERHRANLHPPPSAQKDPPRSQSLDLIADDDLQILPPSIPHIKREINTPSPKPFVFSTPTQLSHVRSDNPSSGVKSASGLSRKAYLKQVKQSWTKKTPLGLSKKKSLGSLAGKKRALGAVESDDELA